MTANPNEVLKLQQTCAMTAHNSNVLGSKGVAFGASGAQTLHDLPAWLEAQLVRIV